MKLKKIIFGSAAFYLACKFGAKALICEEALASFEKRCELQGLKSEKYFLTTEDDYILSAYRLIDENNKHSKV